MSGIIAKGGFNLKRSPLKYSINLTNGNTSVIADNTGKVLSYSLAKTDIQLLLGSELITSGVSYSYVKSDSAIVYQERFSYITKSTSLSIESMPNNITTGYIRITATVGGVDVATADFTVTKVKNGSNGNDAVLYYLIPSDDMIIVRADGSRSPEIIKFTAYKQVGNNLPEVLPLTSINYLYKVDNDPDTEFFSYVEAGLSSNIAGESITFAIMDYNGIILDRQTIPIVMEGRTGPSIRLRGRWVEGTSYSAGPTFIDVVYKDTVPYRCIIDHVASQTNKPESAYWGLFNEFQNIATDLLLVKYAWIENLGVANLNTRNPESASSKRIEISGGDHTLSMYDDSNNLRLKITGDNLPDFSASNTSVALSNMSSSANNTTNYDFSQKDTIETETLLCNFAITATNNSIQLPNLNITIWTGVHYTADFQYNSYDCTANADVIIKNATTNEIVFKAGGISMYYWTDNYSINGENLYKIKSVLGKVFTLPVGNYKIVFWKQHRFYGTRPNTPGYYTVGANLTYYQGITAPLIIAYPQRMMLIGANGFRNNFALNNYLESRMDDSGNAMFIIRSGNIGLKVSTAGIQKWNGSAWVSASI